MAFDIFLLRYCVNQNNTFYAIVHEILANYTILSVNVTKFLTYSCNLARLYGFRHSWFKFKCFHWKCYTLLTHCNTLMTRCSIRCYIMTHHLHIVTLKRCMVEFSVILWHSAYTLKRYCCILCYVMALPFHIVTLKRGTVSISVILWHSAQTL